jgi:SAM-dependent methyltransferase
VRGFDVLGIDFSEDAIRLCRHRLAHLLDDKRLRFECKDLSEVDNTFDVVFMMEVLEHIEDDGAALETVAGLLRRGGHLLLSVPANARWFGPSDHCAGHYRRYERGQLLALVQAAGFEVTRAWSYGVPLANLTEVVRNVIFRNRFVDGKKEATKRSGINRSLESRFRYVSNDFFLFPFYLLQRLFVTTNLGTGLLLKAVKK